MEKFIFLATIKDKLTEMNLPKDTVEKHVKIFDDCLKGKSADEIDKIINSAGGIDGVVKSIANLENAKKRTSVSNKEITHKTQDNSPAAGEVREKTEVPVVSKDDSTADTENVTSFSSVESPEKSEEPADILSQINDESDPPTIEIETTAELTEHIRDAEKMTETLERLVVTPGDNSASEEYADELSDYDFETLFAERLSKPEAGVKKLREKLSSKAYKWTLPIAILLDIVLFVFIVALFPLLLASAIVLSVVYICLLVAGVCFTIVPIGYGIYMCFKSIPIALYELSIGLISTGVTMFVCILLYNYVKRLVPFLFKQLRRLFMLWVRVTKRYFGKTVKEEN